MLKESLKNIYLFIRTVIINAVFIKRTGASDLSGINSILVIRTDRIGDMILSVPFFKGLRKRFPRAKIDVLARGPIGAIINCEPSVNSIIEYKGFVSGVIGLRKKYDLSIDMIMDYRIKPSLIAYFSSKKFSAGYEGYGKGNLFSITIPDKNEKQHFVEYTNDLLRRLGGKLEEQDKIPEIFLSSELIAKGNKVLEQLGLKKNAIAIAVHPGGYYPSQRWSAAKYGGLIKALLSSYDGIKILVFGEKKECSIIERIKAMLPAEMRNLLIPVCNHPLDEIEVLLSRCAVFIGNNSGLLHMAAALRVPTVSFMGPTVPWLWAPLGEKNIVINKNLDCQPCSRSRCRGHECLEAISVKEALNAVEKFNMALLRPQS